MNYNSVILVGVVLLTTVWWFVHGLTRYPGPKILGLVLLEGQVEDGGAMADGGGIVRLEKGDV